LIHVRFKYEVFIIKAVIFTMFMETVEKGLLYK